MLSELKIIAKARETANLHDLGDDSFLEGLEVLVRSANTQGRLNDVGMAMFEGSLVGALVRRLKIEHWYAMHPEIDEQEIVKPLFGLGLPRTGSTALGCTLAEDPAVRSLRMWEASNPCPPPDIATEADDPRIAESYRHQEVADKYYPRLKTMIPVGPHTVAECHPLMAMDFKCQEFVSRVRLPDYVDWLLNRADLVPTYRYMKRALKLLQWRRPPNRWRLKSPAHMPFVNALDKVFPDAVFWMTHRDIGQVIPSAVDLYHELHRSMTDELDAAEIIDKIMKWWTIGLNRVLAFRDNGNDHRFVDVQFAEFQRDPEVAVEKIYAFMGETLSDEARARMAAWRLDQARDKHGKHVLDTIAAGLDLAEIRRTFAFYSDRYVADQPA